MRGAGAVLGAGVVLGWVVFALAGWLVPVPVAVGLGAVAGGVSALLRAAFFPRVVVAVLAPFGVMLPALALRDVAVGFGVPVPGFSTLEIAVFLVGYVAFLCSAFGVIRVDLYRYGYAPLPVAGIVLVLCLYALVTGNWFLAGVAVAGQAAWVMGWGSSNWFDMVLHVVLVPVAAVVLVLGVV